MLTLQRAGRRFDSQQRRRGLVVLELSSMPGDLRLANGAPCLALVRWDASGYGSGLEEVAEIFGPSRDQVSTSKAAGWSRGLLEELSYAE